MRRDRNWRYIAGIDTLLLFPKTYEQKEIHGLVCLLHGYGASAENLLPLVEHLELPFPVIWALPNGILPRHPGENTQTFVWAPLDLERLIEERKQAQATGTLDALYDQCPEGWSYARERVTSWLEKLCHEMNISWSQVVLGGFSQGAMLSVEVALRLPALAGLGVFSGSLLNRREWASLLPTAPQAPRFQSHGGADPVLPLVMGEALHNFLQQSPLQGEFLPFSGGHEIPFSVTVAWQQALLRWFSKKRSL